MSTEATKAFEALVPYLRGMRDAAALNQNVRTTPANISLVGAKLAFRFDPDKKGYVDETIEQLCDVLPIGYDTVSRALQCLNALGIWVTAENRGSKWYGTRRIPGPELCAAAHRIGIPLHAISRAVQLDLGALNATSRAVPEPTPRDVAVHSTRHRVPTPRDVALLQVPLVQPKDDDARDDTQVVAARQESSSSLSIDLLVDITARWYAKHQHGKPGQRPLIAGIAKNIRAERLDEMRGYVDEGLDLMQALSRMVGGDLEPKARVEAHPPDCVCAGERVVERVEDGRQVFAPCPGVLAVSA